MSDKEKQYHANFFNEFSFVCFRYCSEEEKIIVNY